MVPGVTAAGVKNGKLVTRFKAPSGMKTGSVEDNNTPLLMDPDHKFTNTVAPNWFDEKP